MAAAITKGIAGETLNDLAALREAGAAALSDDGRPVVDTACLAEAMQKAPALGMLVAAHCEDLYLAKKWYLNEGEISAQLGLPGVPAAAEDCGTAREIAVAAVYGVPVHICHVSTATSAALIRDAKARGVQVTAETAPHYLLLTDRELLKKDADYRMNPPLRTEKDRLAMIEALRDGTFAAMPSEDWDSVIHTDLTGFYNVVQPMVMPMVRRRKPGRIVVISSVSGVVGNRGQVNYSAAKAGLIGAAKALATELASRSITVNAVAPGLIETEMVTEEVLEHAMQLIPMRRIGKPEEVAGVVSFLMSEAASYVTRQVIGVNGGLA